jgi:hypothetical protein
LPANSLNFVTRFACLGRNLSQFNRTYRPLESVGSKNKGDAMKVGTLVVATALALPAATVHAEPVALTGDGLRQAVSGKTVFLNISGFELPITYAANGRMSGKMGAVAASFARGDGAQDRGKWWVEADRLCQQWSSWMDGKAYCYRLTRDGAKVSWVRNDGRSGTARIGN